MNEIQEAWRRDKKKNHSEKIKSVFNWRPEGARRGQKTTCCCDILIGQVK